MLLSFSKKPAFLPLCYRMVTAFTLVFTVPVVCAAEDLTSESLAPEQGDRHGIYLGLSRQRQQFVYEDRNLATEVSSRTLQYQYSRSDWRAGIALGRSAAEESDDGAKGYQLEFNSQSLAVFSELTLADFWLAVALTQGSDVGKYQLVRNDVAGQIKHDTGFRNLGMDVGYGQFLTSSYWSVSGSLTQQWLDTSKRLDIRRPAKPALLQNSDSKEQALLAGFNGFYEVYFTLNERYELALSAALDHQFTVSGGGQTQLTNQRQGRTGIQLRQSSEEVNHSAGATTAISVRLSLLHPDYSLSGEMNQLTDQSMADAYYGLGLGVNF